MSEVAFRSEELGLSDAEQAGALHEYRQFGPPTVGSLVAILRRNGYRTDGVLESARLLSLEEYREVEAVYKSLPEQPQGKIRRRR